MVWRHVVQHFMRAHGCNMRCMVREFKVCNSIRAIRGSFNPVLFSAFAVVLCPKPSISISIADTLCD
jgi:hypothetical protein